MTKLNRQLEEHYLKERLYEDIVERLKDQGVDLGNVTREAIAGVDEFHVRGAVVSKELAASIDLDQLNVLDVGCGLGGPCRMLAEEYDCTVTGIDLSNEYIRTASALSKLVNLDHKTTFIQGDAANLPFSDSTFDVVWTQHVQMNIPDKEKFYSEIVRVLKPGGYFQYYDIFQKNRKPITYPMPWAATEAMSFLVSASDMHEILSGLGLKMKSKKDETQAGIDFFEALLEKIKESGPPKLGLNVIMGESTKPKLLNLLSHLQEGRLMLESGVYKK